MGSSTPLRIMDAGKGITLADGRRVECFPVEDGSYLWELTRKDEYGTETVTRFRVSEAALGAMGAIALDIIRDRTELALAVGPEAPDA